jgi:hypothetical protein
MQFCWLKLLVGVLHILVAALLFAVLMGLAWMFGSKGVSVVLFLIWLSLLGIINFIFRHYLGYLLKAGHVAVIAQAFRDGSIPEAPFKTGVRMVKNRFGTANVYFVIDKLVGGAVKQLQNLFGRTVGMLGGIPGADALSKLGKFFIDISLGYVDECCLGYTFYNETQSAYKSAADGVVIYAQNWKTLLKNAAVTMFVVILVFALVVVVAALLFIAVIRLTGAVTEGTGIIGFVLALLTAYTIKYAFIDTWILVKMMSSYMAVAPTTQITFDLYGKLKGMSSKFGELLKKAEVSPAPATNVPSETPPTAGSTTAASAQSAQAEVVTQKLVYCSQCGAPVASGVKFCGKCGNKITG